MKSTQTSTQSVTGPSTKPRWHKPNLTELDLQATASGGGANPDGGGPLDPVSS